MTPSHLDYRALISITACRRPENLCRYLPHFAAFCREDPRFRLLVALDGTEESYLRFCREWEVPLLYSDDREGVGLSKNRVLRRYGEFDYYFFVEDDVELVDGSVFLAHVDMYRESGIPHFSLFERGGTRGVRGTSRIAGYRVVHGMFGGAHFNFFARDGLNLVCGWHPRFAEFRRWGHTEHSYRFFRRGLAPAPFNVAVDLAESFIWHYPPAVTRVEGVVADKDQLSPAERELIDQELTYVPLQTLSAHHVNSVPPGSVDRLASVLDSGERYPLVHGTERRHCHAEYDLWRFRYGQGRGMRLRVLVASVLRWPTNPALRHLVRRMLKL